MVWVPSKAIIIEACIFVPSVSGRHIHPGIGASSISGYLAEIWAASSTQPVVGMVPIWTGMLLMMNLDMRELALISNALIWISVRPLQISESKGSTAVEWVLVRVWRMIGFFPVALANLKLNWPLRDSLIEQRILESMEVGGVVSGMVATTSRCTGNMVVLKRAAGFLVLFCDHLEGGLVSFGSSGGV